MSLVRKLGRRLAERLARRVEGNALFEKPGERAPTPPLNASAARKATSEEAAFVAPSSAMLAGLPAIRDFVNAPGELVLVNHWATWCIPCVDEFPHLKALFARVGDRVPFTGLCWDLFDPRGEEDEIVSHVEAFSEGHGISWRSLVVRGDVKAPDFFDALGMTYDKIPQTWLISATGEVLERIDGALDAAGAEALARRIEALLARPGGTAPEA